MSSGYTSLTLSSVSVPSFTMCREADYPQVRAKFRTPQIAPRLNQIRHGVNTVTVANLQPEQVPTKMAENRKSQRNKGCSFKHSRFR